MENQAQYKASYVAHSPEEATQLEAFVDQVRSMMDAQQAYLQAPKDSSEKVNALHKWKNLCNAVNYRLKSLK